METQHPFREMCDHASTKLVKDMMLHSENLEIATAGSTMTRRYRQKQHKHPILYLDWTLVLQWSQYDVWSLQSPCDWWDKLLLCLLAVAISNNWKCMIRTCANIADNSFLIAQGVHSTQKKAWQETWLWFILTKKDVMESKTAFSKRILDPNMHSMLAYVLKSALCA